MNVTASTAAKSAAVNWRVFKTRLELAAALAEETARALVRRIETGQEAAIALSGGSTPRLFLEQLSRVQLDWRRVQVTLVDERWVNKDAERSNERLIGQLLLQGAALPARFTGLKTKAAEPETALDEIEGRIRQMPLPLAATILGMGEDGHTASLFPGGDRLKSALDPMGKRAVECMRAPGAGEPRVTLTFPILSAADFLAIHIEGESKRQALLRAEEDGPLEDMPIRAFLRAARPVEIFWAA